MSYDGSVQAIFLPVVAQATHRSQEANQNSSGTLGGFQASALTPPEIKISFDASTISNDAPTQFISQEIKVNLGNQGQEDARQVLVSLGASQAGQEISWTEPQTVTALAGVTTPMIFEWAADIPGEWDIQVQAKLLDPEPTTNFSATVKHGIDVLPAQETTIEEDLTAFGLVAPWQVVLFLASVVMTAGLAGWVILRSISKDADTQQPMLDEEDPGQV